MRGGCLSNGGVCHFSTFEERGGELNILGSCKYLSCELRRDNDLEEKGLDCLDNCHSDYTSCQATAMSYELLCCPSCLVVTREDGTR